MTGRAAIKDRLPLWQQPGSSGFFAWLDDVRPMVPSEKGGFVRYEIPTDRVRDEIRTALDGGYSTVVLCWPRRHGKTVVAELIILWRFLTRRTQTVAIVANSATQTIDTGFKLLKSIIMNTPYTKALADSGAIFVGSDFIDYVAAGNRIQGYASNVASLYGKKLSVAQVSELHASRTDAVYQALASSTIDSDDGLIIVDSTVGPRSSPLFGLYNLFQNGADESLYFSHISYRDLDDALANCPAWIKPARLRSRAAQMLPQEFAQQHLNLWGSGSSSLFPPDLIDRCKQSYALDPKVIAEGRPFVVGAGLDRAYGFSLHGDATVTTAVMKVVDGEDEHFYVLASDAIKFSSAGGIKRAFTRYHKDFGLKRVAIEAFNAQDIAAWAGDQRFEHEIAHATSERQSNVFTALYNAASEGRLHIHPSFEKLLREMGTFEYFLEASSKGGTVAKFEHAKGCHDDHVYSLAWAVYALREIELNPYELTGIHCDAPGPVARLCLLNDGALVPHCHESCRSFQQVNALYQIYRSKSGCAAMSLEDFFTSKVVNIGSNTVKR